MGEGALDSCVAQLDSPLQGCPLTSPVALGTQVLPAVTGSTPCFQTEQDEELRSRAVREGQQLLPGRGQATQGIPPR